MIRVHAVISGRVQGVWFRATAAEVARKLGLAGWVRNRPDGTVETVAEGPEEAVDRYLAWCRQGPEMARVDRVDEARAAPVGLQGEFQVRPTG